MTTVYLADHPLITAVPAFLPAFIVVGIIVALVVRDRRRGDDDDDQPFLDEDEMMDTYARELDEDGDAQR
ncbi:MAG: hypothetical protein QM728_03410 [Gordonia sp. (in: high G+C Gram-positive bacteria)]|uniref:hypothetical protein n=1 Tax=Gordonia sp. (in: high G+C Gram-positive bacteria) TaxID=84139 RepID=UPI0039E69374